MKRIAKTAKKLTTKPGIKTQLKVTALSCLFSLCGTAYAGDVSQTTVTSLMFAGSYIGVKTSGGNVNTAQASCATAGYSWAIAYDAPAADFILKALLTAKVSEVTVRISGTGQCRSTEGGNKEYISFIMLDD